MAALTLIYIYTFVYDAETADINKYHFDAGIMASALPDDPASFFSMLSGIGDDHPHIQNSYYDRMGTWRLEWDNGLFNDCHTIVRLTSVLFVITGGSIWAMGIIMAFFSFLAMWLLSLSFQLFGVPRFLSLLFFLFPSVLFWTSGLLKEGYLIMALSLLVFGVFHWMKGISTKYSVFAMVIGFLFLLYLKIYVLVILFPGILGLLVALKLPKVSPSFVFFGVFLFCLLLVPILPWIDPDWNIIAQLVQKQKNFFGLVSEHQPGSEIAIPELNTDWWSFIKAAPVAFWNVLTRPYLFEAKGMLQYFSSLENLIIITVLVISLFQRVDFSHDQKAFMTFLLFFMILETLIIGWVTPVVGAIVRYKVPVLIFLSPFLSMRFSNYWNKKTETVSCLRFR